MPTSCVAFGCFHRGSVEGITYHGFPKNEELRKRWIVAVKRKDWEPTKHSKLCSAHFQEADIDRTSLAIVRIRAGAIPTIFPAISQVKERRILKRAYHDANDIQTHDSNASTSIESPKKKLKTELVKKEIVLKLCGKKIKYLHQSKRRLNKKVANLENVISVLQNRLHFQEELCSFLTSLSKSSECLIKRTAAKYANPKLKGKYDDRLKGFAITLHFLSPKAYNFIRKNFDSALPHPRTLRRWYGSVDAEPGFSTEVFRALKEYSSNAPNKPICSLMFDCMSIRKHFEWDGNRFHGTINSGSAVDDDSAPSATEALVFHLVFINGLWKIPLGHFFVAGISGDQLSGLVNQCLRLLHDSDVEVASLTCDGAASNIAMASSLGCSLDPQNLQTSFLNVANNKPIHFFLDPCHMLKLVRNTIGDYKVILDSKNETIEWSYIEKLHNLQNQEGLRLGNKLTNSHICYIKQKMKVKLAAQVLSTSVADSLQYLQQNRIHGFEGCSATITFLKTFDKVFDILNSRSIRAKYGKQAMNQKNFKMHSEVLLETKRYILGLKDKDGVPILSSQRKTGFLGFIICIESALAMYDRYVSGEQARLKYLPLYKVSQDHIERLFGYIRSRGGRNNNPTCKEFTSSFKRILLHKELEETNSGNTLVLNKSLIFSLTRHHREEDAINSSTPGWRALDGREDGALNDEEIEDVLLYSLQSTSNIARDITEYIAGFIVHSIQSKIICEHCSALLVSNMTQPNSLIKYKNRGGLIQPSQGVIKLCLMSESTVKYYINSSKFHTRTNLTDSMISTVLQGCVGVDLFPGLHHLEQEPEHNHIILLMKAICKRYLSIRLHHYSKTFNDNIHYNKIRQHLNKTVNFLGQ